MLLRLGLVVARGLAGRRIGFLEESAVPMRVWPNDLDANLHMNNSRYLLAMDVGRWDLVVRTGLLGQLHRRRWYPVLASATVRFRRPLDPWQRYTLRTHLFAWNEKWTFLEQRFEIGGQAHAIGRVKALFRGRGGNVPTAALFEAAGVRDVPPVRLPEDVRAWLEAERLERGVS
jgi:acyl-CoA thioesterase FadM